MYNIGMQNTDAKQMGDGQIVKMIGKAVNEIVKMGKHNTEGRAVIEVIPSGKIEVTWYLGNTWTNFGDDLSASGSRILYSESFDADSPKFFKGLNLHGQDYRENLEKALRDAYTDFQARFSEIEK